MVFNSPKVNFKKKFVYLQILQIRYNLSYLVGYLENIRCISVKKEGQRAHTIEKISGWVGISQ